MQHLRLGPGQAAPTFESRYGLKFSETATTAPPDRPVSMEERETVAGFIEKISSRIDDLLAASPVASSAA